MSDPSPRDPALHTWRRLLELIMDPAQLRRAGTKAGRVAVIAGVVTAPFLVGAFWVPMLWIVAGIGLLGVAIWTLQWWTGRTAATFTDDDLISMIVAEEGLIVQGGLALPWSEIKDIECTWRHTQPTADGYSGAARVGAAAGDAIVRSGADPIHKIVEVRLRDYRAVDRRATKARRRVLVGPVLNDPGCAFVGLAGRGQDEMQRLMSLLEGLCQREGIPFRIRT